MGKKCFMIAAVIANVSCSLENYENERGEYELLFKRKNVSKFYNTNAIIALIDILVFF